MQFLGHSWVDVLKIDIEGGEWAVLDDLLQNETHLPFTQLQVQCHDVLLQQLHICPCALMQFMCTVEIN